MRKRNCFCYTADEQYLLPTMVSATQLRSNIEANDNDILILCIGAQTARSAAALSYCTERSIKFLVVPETFLEGLPVFCARFFLAKLLANAYDKIIYLDGDTQIIRSVAPMANYDLDTGFLLAAVDPMALALDTSRGIRSSIRQYLVGIGVPKHRLTLYFNSGVICANVTDWDAISKECIVLFNKNRGSYKFPDQDPLNIVVGDSHIPISMKWNLPAFLLNFEAAEICGNHIVHFMSNPRPWNGNYYPWSIVWVEPYRNLAKNFDGLFDGVLSISIYQRIKYSLQQKIKSIVEPHFWDGEEFRASVGRAEERSVV